MLTRRIAAALMLTLAIAGCANNNTEAGAPSGGIVESASPSVPPSTTPGTGEPSTGAAETISGTVVAGVEPGCLLLQDGKALHLLIFTDKALEAQAKVGSPMTVTGESRPGEMSTCQQGVPFHVASVKGA